MIGYELRRLSNEHASELVCRSCREVVGVFVDVNMQPGTGVRVQLTKAADDHAVRCLNAPQVVTRAALLAASRRAFESAFPEKAGVYVAALDKGFSDAAQLEAALEGIIRSAGTKSSFDQAMTAAEALVAIGRHPTVSEAMEVIIFGRARG